MRLFSLGSLSTPPLTVTDMQACKNSTQNGVYSMQCGCTKLWEENIPQRLAAKEVAIVTT